MRRQMLIQIPDVLTPAQVAECRKLLDAADWVDGAVTAGHQSGRAKDNMQLPEEHPAAVQMGDLILAALERNPLFVASALPLKVFPPLFNRYEGGQNFGTHVDNAIRQVKGTEHRVRTDLSATLFFSEPDEYEGGELVVEDNYGVQRVKLPAGHLILYPASSLHHVTPVSERGETGIVFLDTEHGARRRAADAARSTWTCRSSGWHGSAGPPVGSSVNGRLS